MRKVLAFVLALAMILGCFSTAFAKTFTDVEADAKYATAVDVLSDLGVVSGYGDDYRPAKVVTRAEMASLLVKALGLTPSAATTTKFSDVKSTDWFAGWVAYANSLGIIAGRTNGTFGPNDPVSYDDAIVMLINALGYSGSLTGVYPTAFIIKAQSLGITKGVTLLGTEGANRGDIAQLVYNTLGCQIGTTNKDGIWTKNDETMYDRLGATDTATIVADKNTKTAIDLSEYFGAEIKVRKNEDGEVIAVVAVNTTFVEGKVDTTGKKIGTTTCEAEVATLVSGAAFYLNGATATTPALSELKATAYKYAVTFNDDDEIDSIVSLQIWQGKDIQVTEDMVKNVKAVKATPFGSAYTFALSKDGKSYDDSKVTFAGLTALADVEEDGIVTLYKAGGTGNVCKVEYNGTPIIGKITKIAGGKATIEGKEFAVPAGDAKFDKDYIVYVNYAGDQFGTTELYDPAEEEAESLYGVTLGFGGTDTTGEFETDNTATRKVKLLAADGTEQTITVKSSADENMLSTTATAAAWKSANTGNVGKLVEYKLNDDGEMTFLKAVSFDGTVSAVEKGLVDSKKLAADVVVFTYYEDGDDVVATAAKTIADGTYASVKYTVNTKGQIDMILAGEPSGALDGNTFNGIFLGYDQTGAKAFNLTFLVDGAEKVYVAEAAPTFTFVTSSAMFDTYTLTSEGNFKAQATTDEFDKNDTIVIVTGAAINDGTLVIDEDNMNTGLLADGVVFYMLDDDELTVSDQTTFLEATGTIYVYDNWETGKTAGDGYIDFIVFEKPAEE